jgi:hypothetical protein
VLDRLSAFQYRIKTDAAITFSSSSQKRTVSNGKGGVCQMGRAASSAAAGFLGAAGHVCWKIADKLDANIMRCKHVDNGQTNITWPKRVIKSPEQMYNESMRKRQQCRKCSPPPKFVLQNGQSMPAPEVGYGRPFRWETARLLAGDLRFFLCGNATDCPHIQADEWTLTNFLQRYFKAPEALLKPSFHSPNASNLIANISSMQAIVSKQKAKRQSQQSMHYLDEYEQHLWEEEEWVICTQNGSNCYGSIG